MQYGICRPLQNYKGERTPHPVIDYQLGSVRDDFDFGSLLMFRTDYLKRAINEIEAEKSTNIPHYMLCD